MKPNSERQKWNQENLQQVTDVLVEAGYRSGTLFTELRPSSTIEMWVGPGRVPVSGVQRYADDMGFELLAPLTTEMKMDDVVGALREATSRRQLQPQE